MMRKRKIRGRVLLVEDDDLNMELMQTVLEGAGFEVMGASSAAAGIDVARQWSPEVVLMDVQMPGMDGLEATRVLHDDAATAAIPVIAVTAHVKREDSLRCLEAGCVLHLSKPVDTRALPDIVEGVIVTAREQVP